MACRRFFFILPFGVPQMQDENEEVEEEEGKMNIGIRFLVWK